MRLLYLMKLIKFLFFTPLEMQLAVVKESKNQTKVLDLMYLAQTIKLVLLVVLGTVWVMWLLFIR